MKSFRGAPALAAALALASASMATHAGVLDIEVGTSQPSQREAYKALVDDFRAANPDVDARLTIVDAAAQRKALPAELGGDTPPDVFTGAAGEPLRALVQHGLLDDLSDVWKGANWWSTFPSGVATVGGRQYGLPYQVYAWGLFMRRDVLDRAGIKEAPRDLSALITACSKLRKAGFTPIALGAKDGAAVAAWFDFIDLRVNGYDFHARLLDGKVSYNDSDVRRSFMMWKELIDAKCFDASAPAVDARGAEALLYAGRAGLLLAGTVVSAGFPDIVRPQIDYARFPVIDSGQAAAEAAPTDLLEVAAHARNKADARRFLKFAAGNGEQAKLAKALGSFPANRLAAATGTVLDLGSYKVLTDAKANIVQGYDRDTPADMADQGARAFQAFLAQPGQLYPLLDRLDAVRAAAYAPPVAVGDATPPRPGRKN